MFSFRQIIPLTTVLCFLLIANISCAIAAPPATPPRTITADYQQVKGPTSQIFRECIGAGRAAEGLRAQWQSQLQLIQSEINFHYLRFHGILHDDMGVYTEAPDGTPRYNWQNVDEFYDTLLAAHIRPFVEISFMPSALASGKQTIFWWHANVSAPKSYAKWDDLITALVAHWTDRYGPAEVKQWYFEIWNEADYTGFFQPRDPSHRREEYFELFAHTAAAVKKVNPAYRVGGPASSGTDWIIPFTQFAAANKIPLDFVSFHAYGLGNGPGGLDEFGNDLHYLSPNLHAVADIANAQRQSLDATAAKGIPIHLTEWSASYSSRDPIHDDYLSAPYILEQFKRTEPGIASMSYWVFTDIFEENGPGPTPFHGGFGLLNQQGIKKPAYFAYQFLNRLGNTELQNADPASWITRDDTGGIQILLYDLTRPTTGKTADQIFFRQLRPSKPKGEVQINLTHIPPGNYQLSLWQVSYEKNDAYSAWLKMHSPPQLTRDQEANLRAAATGQPEFTRTLTIPADGQFMQSLPLRENDILLLTLTRQIAP